MVNALIEKALNAVSGLWMKIAAIGIFVLSILAFLSKVYSEGRKSKEADQLKERIRASEERKKSDEQIRNTTDADLDKRASKWVRPD